MPLNASCALTIQCGAWCALPTPNEIAACQRTSTRRWGSVWPWLGLAGLNQYGIAAVRLLAVSGWRRGEVTSLKWTDIDGRTAILGDTKTGRSIRPLAHAALDVLAKVPKRANNPYVFPAASGEGPIGGLPRYWTDIRIKAGLPTDITPHILRHSVASIGSDLLLSEAAIASLLGHKSGTITGRYIHSADAVLLAAADKVANEVLAQMGEKQPTGKVANLRDTARA